MAGAAAQSANEVAPVLLAAHDTIRAASGGKTAVAAHPTNFEVSAPACAAQDSVSRVLSSIGSACAQYATTETASLDFEMHE
jgi:hypothetical protein